MLNLSGIGRWPVAACVAAFGLMVLGSCASAVPAEFIDAPEVADHAARLPQDEIIYFVLPDRFENGDPLNDTGGIEGDRLAHGFDPTHKGFYHGGDLKGLINRLDYVEGLGATAIWLGPIYQNKAVQGPPGDESAGYHGYWITDFTSVDRHFGTEADMRAFVDAVHGRGMKLYLDIITNHTADVIQYRECADADWEGERVSDGCAYRSVADYPYTTRGGRGDEVINEGFMGHSPPFQTEENFRALTDFSYAYTPYIPAGEENVKTPAWLNDLRYYHNRGNSSFAGESSTMGDFAGLDDLMTEDPAVVAGFIEIFQNWITKYRIDGFRVDTTKHVNSEFWQAFNPAILEHARSIGLPNFTVFGEAYHAGDAAMVARHSRTEGFPAMLDFGFQDVVARVLIHGDPAGVLSRFFAIDDLYEGDAAYQSPTFIGNHDMGRFAGLLREAHPEMGDVEMLRRVELAHAMMFFARGVPTLYYGDEQGFVSDGHDQLARENMMPSQVEVYNDNRLIGTDATTADSNFNKQHPLYLAIQNMARVRTAEPALRRGVQVERLAEEKGGAFAFSRVMEGRHEVLVAMNMRNEARTLGISVDSRSKDFRSLSGNCPDRAAATGVIELELAPLSYVVCKSGDWKN
ncbi:MAG TPA: alpha-amylase family glycosyl hydrolase [Hyphomonas sp.]|nr:alpha-amylase [Hyphomonas sp.]HRJ00292.1 alpha-amylase family glycosyl hydrolase [Hyphomonas sp.]